jgi:LPXTG-motif cell wall-anchored protein
MSSYDGDMFTDLAKKFTGKTTEEINRLRKLFEEDMRKGVAPPMDGKGYTPPLSTSSNTGKKFPVLPVAIGGAVVLAVVLYIVLKKKKAA